MTVLRAPGKILVFKKGFGLIWTPTFVGVSAFNRQLNWRRDDHTLNTGRSK